VFGLGVSVCSGLCGLWVSGLCVVGLIVAVCFLMMFVFVMSLFCCVFCVFWVLFGFGFGFDVWLGSVFAFELGWVCGF